MTVVALAVRFLLELAGVAAIAVWGWRTGGEGVAGGVLALVSAGVLVAGWGGFVAPRATRSPIPVRHRTVAGGVVLVGVAGLLAAAGEPFAAIVLGTLVVLDTGMLVALGVGDGGGASASAP